MLYKLQDIKQVFNEKIILDIKELEIEKGLIHSLSGPNGAGKTTLLNILGFLDTPSGGSLSFYGKPVSFHENNLQKLRRKVILLDQHPILFTSTVYKNLEFGLKLRKFTKPDRRKIIEESLELVGLRHFMHEPAVNLSGGETQRVALARIMALSPEVLLCDEPTSSVDTENRNKIVNLLKRVNCEKKISIIFTSHDAQHTALLANKTLFLSHGKHLPAGHENIFHGTVETHGDEHLLKIEDTISVPITEKPETDSVKISLIPEKIGLGTTQKPRSIPAEIIRLTKDKETIRVEADAGIIITLALPSQGYLSLNLNIGSKIFLEISGESVFLIS